MNAVGTIAVRHGAVETGNGAIVSLHLLEGPDPAPPSQEARYERR